MLTTKEIEEQLCWYDKHLDEPKAEFEKVKLSDEEIKTLPFEEFHKRIHQMLAISNELAECDTCLKHLQEDLLINRLRTLFY